MLPLEPKCGGSLEVLAEDPDYFAVNKPSGVPVHRGWSRAEVVLTDLVRDWTGADKVHPLHRLDQPTSGVVLFARSAEKARLFGELFARGAVDKRYLALVRGRPPEEGVVDHPIPRRSGGPRRPARTSYRSLCTAEVEPRCVSLVEARPHTGRLHQVRRHLKHIDHPVIGDANYGKGALNRAFRDLVGLERLALHAFFFSFVHPVTDRRVCLYAPLPADLRGPFDKLGISTEQWVRPT